MKDPLLRCLWRTLYKGRPQQKVEGDNQNLILAFANKEGVQRQKETLAKMLHSKEFSAECDKTNIKLLVFISGSWQALCDSGVSRGVGIENKLEDE